MRSIASLKALHCWRHYIAYFLCWWFKCYITYIFLSFFMLLPVKNDQYIFNWLSLKERKYKIIVVLYKCCTMSWKHWQTKQFRHNVLHNHRGLFSFAKSRNPNYISFFILALLPNFVLDQSEKSFPLGFSHKQKILLKINRLEILLFYYLL